MRIILLVCAFVAVAARAAGDNSFAVHGVRVFDGRQTSARSNVVVRNGRITVVGSDIAIPKGIDTIEGAGKTLNPDSSTRTCVFSRVRARTRCALA
jgi:imidazolonepropionase-like amidohydrolase